MAANLDLLHPTLRRKAKAIIADLKGHGYCARARSTWRSVAEQLVLYKHGKTGVKFSFHNALRKGKPCSLAVDFTPCYNRDKTRRFWQLLGRSAKAHGCTWGGDWKMRDYGHVQLLPNSALSKVKKGWSPEAT